MKNNIKLITDNSLVVLEQLKKDILTLESDINKLEKLQTLDSLRLIKVKRNNLIFMNRSLTNLNHAISHLYMALMNLN